MTGSIYEVTAEGQYYSLASGKKEIKPYLMKFKADDTVKKQGFLSAFRNALAPRDGSKTVLLQLMMEKYPDYKRFRTHQITEVINLTEKNKPVKELALMNRNQIIRFIDARGFPIDTDLYLNISDLRQALRDFRTNPDMFAKHQEKRRVSKGPELAVMKSLDELNAKPETTASDTKANPLSKDLDHQKAKPKLGFDPPAIPDDEDITDDGFQDPGIPDFDDEDELNALIDGV